MNFGPDSQQLLLTIGRAGVLSSRGIAAKDLDALLRLLGPPSERQRSDLRRATDIVLACPVIVPPCCAACHCAMVARLC